MDNVIKELSDLIRINNCKESSNQTHKLQTPTKSTRRDFIGSPMRRKNEKLTPKRKIKYVEAEKNHDVVNSCEQVEDSLGDDDEPKLTISEPKKRKRRKANTPIALEEISEEVRNFIETSCIDDQIQNVACKELLSATHVKSIIKQVITDSSVLAMLRNSIYGTTEGDPDFVPVYQPKLTRAKARELVERQLKEGGNDASNISDSQQDIPVDSRRMPMSETQSLITTDFPDEEDDDEYKPEFDEVEEVLSDEESMLSFNETPISSAKQSVNNTPTSISSISPTKRKILQTPKSSPAFVKLRAPHQGKIVAQRTLKFTKKEENSLIYNRTRSKYPMTDTPLEYLEMEFRPPDITPDMYETEIPDEDWRNFLLEFVQPQDTSKVADDDEQGDPMYNLMADAKAEAEGASFEELREEFRGDRAVRVSKKELSELLAELDDIDEGAEEGSDCADEEQVGQSQQACQGHDVQQQSPYVDLGRQIDELTHQVLLPEKHEESYVPPAYEQDIVEIPTREQIVVTFLVPEFSRDQIDVLRCQMEQHVQLLTQSVFMAAYRNEYKFIEEASKGLLNDLMETGKQSGFERTSLFHPFNLRPALETVNFYESRREHFKVYKENRIKKRLQSFGCSFIDRIRLVTLPPPLKRVVLESAALPYPHLLKNCIFKEHQQSEIRRGMCYSEYFLLASAFEPFVKDINIFKVDLEKKRGIKGTSFFHKDLIPVCAAVHKTGKIFCTRYFLTCHVRRILKDSSIKGARKGTPFLNFARTGMVNMPKAEVCPLPENIPCKVKEMNLKILPKSFIPMVDSEQKRKYYGKKLDQQIKKIAGKDVGSYKKNSNNILIIKNGDATEVILPTLVSSLPQSVCLKTTPDSAEATQAVDSANNMKIPKPLCSYNIPSNRPVNTVAPFSVTNTISSSDSTSQRGTATLQSVAKPITPLFQNKSSASIYFTTISCNSTETMSYTTPTALPVPPNTGASCVPLNYPTVPIIPNTLDSRVPLNYHTVPIPPNTGVNLEPLDYSKVSMPPDTRQLPTLSMPVLTTNKMASIRNQGKNASRFHSTNDDFHSNKFNPVTPSRATTTQPPSYTSPARSNIRTLPQMAAPTPTHKFIEYAAAPPTPLLHMPNLDTPFKNEDPLYSQDDTSISHENLHTNHDALSVGYEAPPIKHEAPPIDFEAPPIKHEFPATGFEAPHIKREAPPISYEALLSHSDDSQYLHEARTEDQGLNTPFKKRTETFCHIGILDAGMCVDQNVVVKHEEDVDVAEVEQKNIFICKNEEVETLSENERERMADGEKVAHDKTEDRKRDRPKGNIMVMDVSDSSSDTMWKVSKCVEVDSDVLKVNFKTDGRRRKSVVAEPDMERKCISTCETSPQGVRQKLHHRKVGDYEMNECGEIMGIVEDSKSGILDYGICKEELSIEEITDSGESEHHDDESRQQQIGVEINESREDEIRVKRSKSREVEIGVKRNKSKEECGVERDESINENGNDSREEISGDESRDLESGNESKEESRSDEEETFEMNFFRKVKEILVARKEANLSEFLSLLRALVLGEDLTENIYFKVVKILRGYTELQKDFVMFLSPHQAQRIGKYSDYCAVQRKKELFALKIMKEKDEDAHNKRSNIEENYDYRERKDQSVRKGNEDKEQEKCKENKSHIKADGIEDKWSKEQDMQLINLIQAEGMNAGCVLDLSTRLGKTKLQVEDRINFLIKMLSQQL